MKIVRDNIDSDSSLYGPYDLDQLCFPACSFAKTSKPVISVLSKKIRENVFEIVRYVDLFSHAFTLQGITLLFEMC